MSDRKMADAHVEALGEVIAGTFVRRVHSNNKDTCAACQPLREILALVRSLASGELRCADTKTEVVVERGGMFGLQALRDVIQEEADRLARFQLGTIGRASSRNLRDCLKDIDRWLSTPDLPQK